MRPRRSRWFSPRVTPFVSEAALCETLRAAVLSAGWAFYPEQGGWDVVVVLSDGFTQVGVQAKLRANVDVLAQTIVPLRRTGPDVHAVLVPTCSTAFRDVAEELGVVVLVGDLLRARPQYLVDALRAAPRSTHLPGRCWLPPYAPDGPAGVPAPRTTSAWRVAAAQLCADVRAGLEPTNAQIRERGLSPTRWYRWLSPVPGTRPRRYRLRHGARLPDLKFPAVSRGLGLPDPSHPAA